MNLPINKKSFLELLENKDYCYKKLILDFISKNDIDYFELLCFWVYF